MIEPQKPSFTNQVLFGVSIITLFIAFIFLVIFLFTIFTPRTNLFIDEVEVSDTSGHIEHGHLNRSDEVSIRIRVCKQTDIPVEISAELFDGDKDNVPLGKAISYLKKGCGHVVIGSIVPNKTPIGEYKLRINVYQKINFLREIRDEVVLSGYEVVEMEH